MQSDFSSRACLCACLVVRAALQIAVENMRLKREEEDRARELKDLEARLQRARTKRQLNEKLKVSDHRCPFNANF